MLVRCIASVALQWKAAFAGDCVGDVGGERRARGELYDCGDVVVAAVNWHIRGRGSERELVNKEAHTGTLREGRIARFEGGRISGRLSRPRAPRMSTFALSSREPDRRKEAASAPVPHATTTRLQLES